MVVVTCFHSDRYHPAYCTSVASSSLVVNGWLMMLMLMYDDMAMEVQTNFVHSQNFTMMLNNDDSLIRLEERVVCHFGINNIANF